MAVPTRINERRSLELMHDQFGYGSSVRLLNVIDDYHCEGLGIEVEFSLPSARVICTLDRIIEWRGKPQSIRCDNGPEDISGALLKWAERHGITIDHIQSGRPQQNPYIKRDNRKVRYDRLAPIIFARIAEVQYFTTKWLRTYNNERPNIAFGGITPKMKAAVPA